MSRNGTTLDATFVYPTDGKAVGIGPIVGPVIGITERAERRGRIAARMIEGTAEILARVVHFIRD